MKIALVVSFALLALASSQDAVKPAPKSSCGSGEPLDFQLLPGCSLKAIVEKVMSTVGFYLGNYPFKNKAECRKNTVKIVTNIMDDLLPCIKGNCPGDILSTVLTIVDPSIYEMFKNITVADIKRELNDTINEIEKGIGEAADLICPETGERPAFMMILPQELNATTLATEMLGVIDYIIGAVFDDPNMLNGRAGGPVKCKFFKENLMNLMDADLMGTFATFLPPEAQSIVNTLMALGKDQMTAAKDALTAELEKMVCDENGDDGKEAGGLESGGGDDDADAGASSTQLVTSVFVTCLVFVFGVPNLLL